MKLFFPALFRGLIDFFRFAFEHCADYHFSMQAPYSLFFCPFRLFPDFLVAQNRILLLRNFLLFATNPFVSPTRTRRFSSITTFCRFFFFSVFVRFLQWIQLCIKFHCGQRPFPWHIIRCPIEPLLDFTIFFSMSLPSWTPKLFHSFFFFLSLSSFHSVRNTALRMGNCKTKNNFISFNLRFGLSVQCKLCDWFLYLVWIHWLSRREPK